MPSSLYHRREAEGLFRGGCLEVRSPVQNHLRMFGDILQTVSLRELLSLLQVAPYMLAPSRNLRRYPHFGPGQYSAAHFTQKPLSGTVVRWTFFRFAMPYFISLAQNGKRHRILYALLLISFAMIVVASSQEILLNLLCPDSEDLFLRWGPSPPFSADKGSGWVK